MGDTKITVHLLRHGFPLCDFSREPPANWPPNHKWEGTYEGLKTLPAEYEPCGRCVQTHHLNRRAAK